LKTRRSSIASVTWEIEIWVRQVGEGKNGSGIIEDLEGQQGSKQDAPENHTSR